MSSKIKLLLLVALLAGSLAACMTVKDAPNSGSSGVPHTNTVSVETVEPSGAELRAVIEVPAALPSGESVNLRFRLTNHSDQKLYVLKWYTPLEGLAGEIFYIERDGQALPYQGILASRDTPSPDAYVWLDAGESASAEVDLATAYDFSEAGEYTIQFLSPRISHIARSEAEMAKTLDDLGPVQIPSNRVTVEIGRGTTAARPTATRAATATATPSPVARSTVAPTATPARLSFEPKTYRDERAGFEFEHPRSWKVCFQEEQSRGYEANLCASSPDHPNLSITVALWEPNHLEGYADQREREWFFSGSTVESREEWMLDGDHRAVRFLIKGREEERTLVLVTAVGEHYLTLAGDGDLDLLAEIAGTVRFFEPTKLPPTECPMETGSNLDVTPARQALETFFALLYEGRYAEAVAYYGGDYQVLRDWNPPVDPDDYTRLLENGCTIDGLMCLALKGICTEEALSPVEYRFTVQFAAPDGSTFARPLYCCGGSSEPSMDRFVYTVLKVDGSFLVQELPPYVP